MIKPTLKHTFYAPPESIAGDTIVFPKDEANHAVRVLRLKTGDEAAVVDGIGGWYRVEVEVLGRKNLVGRVLERKSDIGEPSYDLTIGLSLLKNMNRFETFAEKAVEYGVSRIIPIISKRSERSRMKAARVESILVSAMKQCGRSRLVLLESPVKLKKLPRMLGETEGMFLGVCHEATTPAEGLNDQIGINGNHDRALILVGPEGGFTDDELDSLGKEGYKQLYLGKRRLRAESAAMAVAASYLLAERST